jgi:hypothetical protein
MNVRPNVGSITDAAEPRLRFMIKTINGLKLLSRISLDRGRG